MAGTATRHAPSRLSVVHIAVQPGTGPAAKHLATSLMRADQPQACRMGFLVRGQTLAGSKQPATAVVAAAQRRLFDMTATVPEQMGRAGKTLAAIVVATQEPAPFPVYHPMRIKLAFLQKPLATQGVRTHKALPATMNPLMHCQVAAAAEGFAAALMTTGKRPACGMDTKMPVTAADLVVRLVTALQRAGIEPDPGMDARVNDQMAFSHKAFIATGSGTGMGSCTAMTTPMPDHVAFFCKYLATTGLGTHKVCIADRCPGSGPWPVTPFSGTGEQAGSLFRARPGTGGLPANPACLPMDERAEMNQVLKQVSWRTNPDVGSPSLSLASRTLLVRPDDNVRPARGPFQDGAKQKPRYPESPCFCAQRPPSAVRELLEQILSGAASKSTCPPSSAQGRLADENPLRT